MANVQNYMVVDGVLKDLVEDIVLYIDKVSPPAEGEPSFASFIQERLVEDSNDETFAQQEEIFKAIAERSAAISKGPERDFEPQYNLVLHILTFSSNLTAILPILLKNLSTPPTYPNGQTLGLVVLSNLFNILPVSSPLRYQVFLSILEFAASTNNIGLVAPQIKHLPAWLKEWNVDEKASTEIYSKISSFLASANDSKTAYQYLLSAVASTPSATSPLSTQLVQTAIQSESIYDFDELFALEAVQSLKSSDAILYSLLEIVASGDYTAFKSFDKAFLSTNNFDLAQLDRKVRILALTRSASQAAISNRTIPYTLFADTIELPVDEVEVWIIDAIRAGLIEGRLSQMSQSFSLHRATPVGQFGADEWKTVASKLTGWKSSLKDVLEVLKNARENAEKEEEKAAKNRPQPVVVATK